MKRSIVFLMLLLAAVIPSSSLAQISVRSQLSHDETVIAGDSYTGAVLIRNDTDEIQQAKIYQTDYQFASDGSNYFGEAGSLDRSNASWVDVAASSIMVPPRESISVTYQVHVPVEINGMSPSGSYWSLIMVEGVPKTSPENVDNEKPQEGLGVIQVTRYGIQVASHIEGTGEPELSITESALVRSETNEATLHLSVSNLGDTLVRPKIWIELYNESGTALGRREGLNNRIYPGTSVKQQIKLGELSPGSYRALVIMDAGDEDVFGAEYTLNID